LGPTWSPDGKRIAFVSVGNGKFGFYEKSADGSGNEKLLLEDTEVMYPNDWSPDGKFLTFQKIVHGHFAVWILPLNGGKPYPLLPESQGSAVTSVFSPDGKWLAYCSAASGEQQVYVIPFPGPGGKWQVSSTGGCYPRWRSNQKELFYLSSDNKMMAAEVQTSGSSFAIGAVNPLFEAQLYRTVISGYDITPDGQRFIVVYDPGQPNASIALVQNWNAELNK
jgi:Tol biopolymer transport system component